MYTKRCLSFFFGFALCLLPSQLVGQENDGVSLITSRFEKAEFRDYHRIYSELFNTVGNKGLRDLLISDNRSIAIQTAWHIASQPIEADSGDEMYIADVEKLNWFVSFVRGTCRASIPNWWRETIVTCQANRNRKGVYHVVPSNDLYMESDIENVKCRRHIRLAIEGNSYVLVSNEARIILPDKVVEEIRHGERHHGQIAGASSKEYFFVTIHNEYGDSHEVFCIDRSTNDIVWQNEVCGANFFLISWLGEIEALVDVVLSDNGQVFVFGVSTLGIYLHGFDQSDGTTTMMFSKGFEPIQI